MASGYILFDLPEGVEPEDRTFLQGLGYRVEVCHGPAKGIICPILTGESCPLAEGATGIIFEFDLDRAQHRAVLQRYKSSLPPDLPIRVAVRPDQLTNYRRLLGGLRVWVKPQMATDLDAIAPRLRRRSDSG